MEGLWTLVAKCNSGRELENAVASNMLLSKPNFMYGIHLHFYRKLYNKISLYRACMLHWTIPMHLGVTFPLVVKSTCNETCISLVVSCVDYRGRVMVSMHFMAVLQHQNCIL